MGNDNKVILTNEDMDPSNNDRQLILQFVPNELSMSVAVKWAETQVLGMSHTPLQYQYTENQKLPMKIVVMRGLMTRDAILADPHARKTENFLLSLTVPGRDRNGQLMSRPPVVKLTWPNMITANCVLASLNLVHQRFTKDQERWMYMANCEFIRVRDSRVWGDQLLVKGLMG